MTFDIECNCYYHKSSNINSFKLISYNTRLAGTTMDKISLGGVLSLKTASVVSMTFPTVYSAHV